MPKLEQERGPWGYQETVYMWTVWSIGWHYLDNRGWSSDILFLHFGPFIFTFLRSPKYA